MTTTLDIEEREHHIYGASSMPRREACPGSARMERGLPDVKTPAGDAGTLKHAAVFDPAAFAQVDPVGQLDVLWVREQLELIAPLSQWRYELRVALPDDDGGELQYSYFDALYTHMDGHRRIGVLADFKFGRNEQPGPADSAQFATLAAACIGEFDLAEVECIRLQPGAMGDDRVRRYTFRDYDSLYSRVRSIIDECERPGVNLTAGAHCAYCRAAAICPAFREMEAGALAVVPSPRTLAMITPANARDLYRRAAVVSTAMDRLKALLKATLEAAGGTLGEPGNGLVLVEERGDRQIDAKAARPVLAKYLTEEEMESLFVESLPVGRTQALLAEKLRHGGIIKAKIDAEKWMEEHLGVTRKPANRIVKEWTE